MSAWALSLAAALAWLPSLAGAFQFDDFNVIVQEPAVHSWRAFFESATGVRPLLKASYTLNWTLGLGVLGFHVFNVAVHVANTVLAFHVGRALCARWSVPADAALLAALLFALHPVQVEAVTYVSGRSTSLMACFYLGALLAYLRGARAAVPLLLFTCALATKETALTLPAALLLVERDWRRQWPYWAVLFAAIAFVLASPRYFDLVSFGFTQRDLADHFPTQAGGIAYLVARLFGLLGPNIDPALPVSAQWDTAQAALLALLLAAGAFQLRRRPWLGFGLLWFFLQLSPMLVPRLDVANDRQLYLAAWGLFLALAVQLGSLRRPALAAAALACLVALVPRQLDYASEIALWEADSRRAPWNARAHNNLGYAYQQAGRPDDARRAYEAALLFDPGHVRARANLQGTDPQGSVP